MRVDGAKVLVLGMARSGIASVELLCARGASVTASDEKAQESLPPLPVPFLRQSAVQPEGWDLVVVSPGVPADIPLLESFRGRGIPVFGDVEVASWYLRGEVIAITGSNGKTTTTAWTGHVLRECGVSVQVGGNIGVPPAAMVDSSRDGQWNVLELSSFQLETIGQFRARIAAVLNVTPDHLDRHRTLERYWSAKGRIFENQTSNDSAVLNAENEPAARYAGNSPAPVTWFSAGGRVARGVWVEAGQVMLDGQRVMPVAEIPLRGRHNLENAAAAVAMASLAGAPIEGIRRAVATFAGVEHRIEYVRTVRGVEYYNDSKATNVDATLKAIGSFAGGIWIILGGKDKGSDYTVLREPLRERAKAALLIGAAAAKIEQELDAVIPMERSETLDRAVATAHERASAGDVVLLAPACASFDQFDNYEHRGRVFKQLVASLTETSI